jgi:hypothetical protein
MFGMCESEMSLQEFGARELVVGVALFGSEGCGSAH